MQVTIRDGNRASYDVDLSAFHKEVISFGRQDDNDIVLKSEFVSRVHGCIYEDNGTLYIEDLDSVNGLWSRGEKIKRKSVKSGDVIEIRRDGDVVKMSFEESVQSNRQLQQPSYIAQPVPVMYGNPMPYGTPMPYGGAPMYGNPGLRRQARTDRGITGYILVNVLCVLLYIVGIVTLFLGGWIIISISSLVLIIYQICFFQSIVDDVNEIVGRRDGKHTMNFLLVVLLGSLLTFGIAILVWFHELYSRVGAEARVRGIQTDLNAGTFWIFGFLLSFTIIAPFYAIYLLCKTMNMICSDYNARGY